MASMTFAPDAPSELQGVQEPRVSWIPPYVSSAGDEAVELCEMAELHLDPWEQYVLRHSLGERVNGKWAAFEVGVEVSRQNGKGAILEGRSLTGLFLLRERLIIHSAHEFATSLEAFRRLLTLIEDTPDFDRRVKRVSRAHGEEGIELKGGQRIRFRTRTKGGGRGFSADCVILDEAMMIPETAHGALLPTLSARPNPQVWYTGSAVDQEEHPDGVVFTRIRERGHRGDDDSLMWAEWSLDIDSPDEVSEEMATDPAAWAQANPGLGIRILPEHVAREQRSLSPRNFAVERLGVGDWPPTEHLDHQGLNPETWAALSDPGSVPVDPVCFAFDVRPDRSSSSIGIAARRADGLRHIAVVDRRKGTGWLPERIVELVKRHEVAAVACDGASPAAAVLPKVVQALEDAGIDLAIETLSAAEYAQACGGIFDTVENGELRHLGTTELTNAVRGAATRPLGDRWAWSRKSSAVDISPLVACTIALFKVETAEPKRSGRAMFV